MHSILPTDPADTLLLLCFRILFRVHTQFDRSTPKTNNLNKKKKVHLYKKQRKKKCLQSEQQQQKKVVCIFAFLCRLPFLAMLAIKYQQNETKIDFYISPSNGFAHFVCLSTDDTTFISLATKILIACKTFHRSALWICFHWISTRINGMRVIGSLC